VFSALVSLIILTLCFSPNRHGVNQDPPEVKTVQASKEIVVFSNTLEMLYKVVRSANTAFYAGELRVAYVVLVDALRLFKRLDNKKAIGIASNNLGNTMLAMYKEWKDDDPSRAFGLTKKQIVTKGIAYFHEAIQLGEKAYDEFYDKQGWTPICLDFMQHLANRYFNRGLFLMTVKNDHSKPEELEELGRRDLQIARDMDLEVIAYGEDIGWGSADRLEKLFNVNIVRIRGYNLLLKLGYTDDWDTDELLDETFDMIATESKRVSSKLFTKVSMPGRLQEIETELMNYKTLTGDFETASKIAIRMLQEDELVFADAQAKAVEVLMEYVDSSEFGESYRTSIKNALMDYQDILDDFVDERNQATVSDLESDRAIKRSTAGGSLSRKRGSSQNWSLRQSSGRFVTMEDF
jgi:hypothetical protein